MEKLQIENASEWDKRERLDFEVKHLRNLLMELSDNFQGSQKVFAIKMDEFQNTNQVQNERIDVLEDKLSQMSSIVIARNVHNSDENTV